MRVNNKGFTLIELIVVIAIMVIILILALPQVSKIQEANKDRKYEAYKESIRAGSKLHIDSYAKDLFGNNNSGCIRIKYSELKQNNLIKDFGNKDIFCGKDAETFVEVRKVLSEYKYKVNIVCRNIESNKVEWKDEEITGGVDSCSINPDRDGPEIKIKPSSTNNKWYNSKDLNIKIQVSDVSGLNTNTSIIYNWYNKTTGTQYKDNSQNYKNKKGVEKVSFTIPNSKMPSDSGGKYKLTVKPDTSKGYGVQDVLGNVRVTGEEAEEYWIDNEGPKFNNTKVSSTTESYNSKKVIFEMDATDNFTPESDLKVYISNSGYQKGGSWKNYSSQISWTLTGNYDGKSRTIYVSIKDLAGNITEKKFTYTIYKECQSKNITTTSTTGRCSGSCGTGKAVKTYSVKDKYNNASCDGDGETEIVSCNTGIDCCSRTTHKPGSSWTNSGSCSANCGGGKQRQTRPLVSSYDSSVSCGTDSREVSCNTRSCCSSTKHKPGSSWTNSGSCSASCGPGKQTQTRPLVSNYDSSVSCGNDTRTVDCNLGPCCVDTTDPKVSNVTLTVTDASKATVTFNASDSGCSGLKKYVVKLAGQTKEITNINTKSVTFTGITTQNKYAATVTAYDNAGNSASASSSSKCIAGSYRVADKTYSVGEQVRYLCDNWTVLANGGATVRLVRNRPMNKTDVEEAGVNTNSTAIVDGCNGSVCNMSHCAWSNTNPKSSYCWVQGNRTTGTYGSGRVDYSWQRSYIKKVVADYMNKNYLLKQAKNKGHLGTMTFSDETKTYSGQYIRIPIMSETAASNAMSWINQSNPRQQWAWTLSKYNNTGNGAISLNRKYWVIQSYGNTAAAVYPVIIPKKA